MTDKLLTPAHFDAAAPKKDGTFRFAFVTQEIKAPEHILTIHRMYNQMGVLCFAMNEADAVEIPETQPDDTRKTPSKRLRDVLFVLYKQGEQLDSFDLYYRQKMEKFIEHIKGKLND